jgi:hypothetical protein
MLNLVVRKETARLLKVKAQWCLCVPPAVSLTAWRHIGGAEVWLDSQQGNNDTYAYFKLAARSPFFFSRHAPCAVTLGLFWFME